MYVSHVRVRGDGGRPDPADADGQVPCAHCVAGLQVTSPWLSAHSPSFVTLLFNVAPSAKPDHALRAVNADIEIAECGIEIELRSHAVEPVRPASRRIKAGVCVEHAVCRYREGSP